MSVAKANIITQLMKDILPLQGFKPTPGAATIDVGLGPVKYAFPNASFPLGAIHEFICTQREDEAATGGFITAVLGSLMQNGGISVWISSSQTIFPPALKTFGISPDKIIFVKLQNETDILWAMEEALKCDGLAAVVAEMKALSFTASRRFQLAVEQSRVTGFIIRHNPRTLNITACVTRWKITSLPSVSYNDMPGVGFPCWDVLLLKVRNGQPGNWQLEWAGRKFRHIYKTASIIEEQRKKTG